MIYKEKQVNVNFDLSQTNSWCINCNLQSIYLICWNLHFFPPLVVINPFVPNAPFLYPLKTSENCRVFWCFQLIEKGCTGNRWVKGFKLKVLAKNFLESENNDSIVIYENGSLVAKNPISYIFVVLSNSTV